MSPHIISKKHHESQTKSKTTKHYIFAKSTPRSNNINDLPPVSGSQALKISQRDGVGGSKAWLKRRRRRAFPARWSLIKVFTAHSRSMTASLLSPVEPPDT